MIWFDLELSPNISFKLDRRVSAKVKGKVYRTMVRPAMMYGLETLAIGRQRQEARLKMLRFSLGVTRMDMIRNEVIRGTTQTGRLGEKAREARLCLDTCRGGTVDTLVGEC